MTPRLLRVGVSGEPPLDVRLVVNPRARRLTLRPAADGGGAQLTLPPGVAEAEAAAFLERHAAWLRAALARQPGPERVMPGTRLPVAGRVVEIVAAPGARGAPRLEAERLVIPGGGAVAPRAAAFLKTRAQARLLPAVQRYAAMLGRRIGSVSFRDTRSRWGSCASSGRISFSWRLAMAPEPVQDYVAAHEAAHLAEMSHQPRYWAVVQRLMPDYAERRAWLIEEGRALHRFRFDAG